MKIVSFERDKTPKLFYMAAGLLVATMFFTLKQDDPIIVIAGILLAIVSIFPLYLWLLGKSYGLPIWPVFAASNGIIAALPMVQDSKNLLDYTAGEILVGAITLIGFILLGTAVWVSLEKRGTSPPKTVLMISRKNTERYLFLFIIAGLLFYINSAVDFIYFPGNTVQIIRGVTGALSTLGVFVLAFYQGIGMLSRWQGIFLVILTMLTALAAAAGLIMAAALIPVLMLLMGYALGSGKVPWRSLAVVLAVASVLHSGKFAMRNAYWGVSRTAITLGEIPKFYSEWLSYGFAEIASRVGVAPPKPEEEMHSTLFERSGTLHMLLLVQKKSPDEVPFLNGLTYEPIPRLLIPRFLDDQKGLSHEGNIQLSVNYGLQTLEQTKTTSIGWGLIPEAYANFGYLGVAVLAVVLAAFYAFVARITVDVPMTSLRFVIGLLILGAATKADTMGVFVTSQFQGLIAICLAALILMKSQPNPFADGEHALSQQLRSGEPRWLSPRWARGTEVEELAVGAGIKQSRDGSKSPRWMPHGRRIVQTEGGGRRLVASNTKVGTGGRHPIKQPPHPSRRRYSDGEARV